MGKKQWAMLMLVAIIASFMTLPLSFAETKAASKTLTVGYIDYDGYIEKAQDGLSK